MGGVVAPGHGVNIVELVTIEIPIVNEAFGELLVVGLHLWHGGTKSGRLRVIRAGFPL
jgi:hypothetical protein